MLSQLLYNSKLSTVIISIFMHILIKVIYIYLYTKNKENTNKPVISDKCIRAHSALFSVRRVLNSYCSLE